MGGGWRARWQRSGREATFASLSDCRVDLEANRWGIVVPGFEAQLPDGVFVREIAKGSFEQVTLRLGLLHALAEWGVPVCNSAARHRADGGQIDDLHAPAQGGHRHARDLGDRARVAGASHVDRARPRAAIGWC